MRHSKNSAGGKLQRKLVLKNINFASLTLAPQESKTRKGKYTPREKEGADKEQKEMEMTKPMSSRNKAEDSTSAPLDTRRISKKCVKDGAHLTVLTEEMS